MHSYTSASPAAWGLPLPPSPTEEVAERSSRKRKTRRFVSGSTQLKTLVLPTLNTTNALPQSAPLPAAYSTTGRREISEQSLDPTISFLSHPHDTPMQPRRRSNTWAAADALKVLEGTSSVHLAGFEEIMASDNPFQSILPRASFHDLRECSIDSIAPHQFTPSLVEQMIVEEDSTAFLSNQFDDAGDQSFSSMVGELSITDSETDRAYVEEQTVMDRFSESELPRPISVQLIAFSESPRAMEESGEECMFRVNQASDEALEIPTFSSTMTREENFANPLASPYLQPDTPFEHIEDYYPSDVGRSGLSGQEETPSQSSSITHACDGPFQLQRHSTGIGFHTAKTMIPNPLKAAPPRVERKRSPRPQSPLELLRRTGGPTTSVASITDRNIFGSISRYTSYIREVRRDPTALARRVIANAWCSNWNRFGKLSWWVLGLFLGPAWKQQIKRRQGWEAYDGENIAQAEHERLNGSGLGLVQESPQHSPSTPTTPGPPRRIQSKRVKFDDTRASRSSKQRGSQLGQGMKCKDCDQKSKTSWGRSLYLWSKFSVAIMLAVGGAVIQGPEEMMKDCDLSHEVTPGASTEEAARMQDPGDDDHALLFDYSLNLVDGDNDNDDEDDVVADMRLTESFRTTKSPGFSNVNHPEPRSVPLQVNDTHHTFGAPSMNEYDQYDDNGQSRPSRSRAHQVPSESYCGTSDLQLTLHGGSQDLGTLQWMQNLSNKDFERLDDFHDGDRTIRAIPRRSVKRTHSSLT